MPRKATTSATTADEYDGPAKRTRGAQRASNPVVAPATVAAQRHSSIPATRANRCAGAVRPAVKKQTKAATKIMAKRKTNSIRKPSAAIKSADAPSPSRARATRATKKAMSGNTLPTLDRPTQKQPSLSTDNVAIANKEVKIVGDDGANPSDVPPLPSRGRRGTKPVAAAPLPTTPKTPTRRSKKSDPSAAAPVADEDVKRPTTPVATRPGPSKKVIPLAATADAAATRMVPPLPSRKPRAVAPTTATGASATTVPLADDAASKVPPLPSRKKPAVAPTTSTGFRIVAPRADTPVPNNNVSTPARQRDSVNGNNKTLSPRDENVAAEEDVKPIIHDLREGEPQDLGHIKHSDNENIAPVFEGANAIVDAFNHAARANDRTRPRPSTRVTGKAKTNVAKDKTVPPLPSRKAPATHTAAAASSSRVPPLPHRSTNYVPPLPSRPRRALLGDEQRGATSSQQAPAGGSHEVRRASIQFTVKVKTEEQTDDEVPPADEEVKIEETSSDDKEDKAKERKHLQAWQETSEERDSRTRSWVASMIEERRNPGKRRREDNAQEVAYDIQNDREVNRLAKRRRISDEEVEIKAECVDENTSAKSISQV